MRLSEAIRLGAMLGPQNFGTYSDGDATCAIGAARSAGGDDMMLSFFQIEHHLDSRCPECGDIAASSWCDGKRVRVNVIPHLNDHHRWTRERIADWVETLEAAQPQAQPQTVAALVAK